MPSVLAIYCDCCCNEVDLVRGYECDLCDTWRCEECGSCTCDDSDDDYGQDYRVRQWNYRPRPYRPKGDYDAHALLGVELEVAGRQAGIADVVQSFDPCEEHLYMKHDGSINGVEIVTHPMTLPYARQYPFVPLLSELRHVSGPLDDEYGLHVHVSRNAFRRNGKQSSSHQMAWLLFMHRNVEHLETLARRSSNRWASFRDPEPGELARKATTISCDDRYVAVNCNNERTFELRFFKSTLDATEFYAALEFAEASVRYTRSVPIQDVLRGKANTWRHFSEWVRRRNYRNLTAEIDSF